MKKIIAVTCLIVISFSGFSQSESSSNHDTICITSGNVHLESYIQGYSYLTKDNCNNYQIKIDSFGDTVYVYTSSFCKKYGNMTPGQLLFKSGTMKNTALTIGLITGTISGTLIGCSFLSSEPKAMYIPGAIVGLVGGVSSLCLLYTSNKLIKEAGLKMEKIQISNNGFIIKF